MKKSKLTITGARSLSESDIALINDIKAAERALLDMHKRVVSTLQNEHARKKEAAARLFKGHRNNQEQYELDDFEKADPYRWAAFAKAEIQKGAMSLIRAVERPVD